MQYKPYSPHSFLYIIIIPNLFITFSFPTELLQNCDLVASDDDTHKKCHEEYTQLKEEFERYKLRAQSVLKNKSTKVCMIRLI